MWQRRQQLPQQTTTRPALMEGVERTNIVAVRGTEQDTGIPPRWDPYTMKIDRERNCYACGGFGHMAHHCRNWEQRERVVEYREGKIKEIQNIMNNLKGAENLELLN